MRETLELGCEPPCKADRVLGCTYITPQRIVDTNTALHSTSPTTLSLLPHLPFSRATGRVGEGGFSKAPLHPLHSSHRYCNPPPKLLSSPFSPSCPPLSSRTIPDPSGFCATSRVYTRNSSTASLRSVLYRRHSPRKRRRGVGFGISNALIGVCVEPAVRDFGSRGGPASWICAKVTVSSSAGTPFSSAEASLLQSCGTGSAFPFPS